MATGTRHLSFDQLRPRKHRMAVEKVIRSAPVMALLTTSCEV